jgi:hypothetical protein
MRHERRVADQARLVFYYAGEAFPNYAKQSLSIALKDWDGGIVLVHDSNPTGISPRIQMQTFTQWCDSEPFRKCQEDSMPLWDTATVYCSIPQNRFCLESGGGNK